MSRYAQIQGGPTLEFPDGTPDSVMDKAVQEHTAPAGMWTPDRLQTAAQGLRTGAVGGADLVLSTARGMVNGPALALRGLVGGIQSRMNHQGFEEGYQNAQAAGRQEINSGQGIVGNEALRTPEGAQLAAGISNLPGVSQIGQALGNIRQGANKLIGPAATDIGAQALNLATLRGAAGIPERVAALPTGGRLTHGTGAAADAVVNAEHAGFTPVPTTPVGRNEAGRTQYAGTKTERTFAGLGGPEQVDARIAVRNQTVSDRLAAIDAKTGEEFPTPAGVDKAVAEQDKAYEALKKFDVPVPMTHQYVNQVAHLTDTTSKLSERPTQEIFDLQHRLLDPANTETVPKIVDTIRELRRDGYMNTQSTDAKLQKLGKVQRQAADILDNQVDSHIQLLAKTTNNPNLQSILSRLHSEYTAARTQLSVLHDVRDAMNPTTGSIDASVLAKLSADGRKLAPNLQRIADAYRAIGANGMRNIARTAKIAGRPLNFGDAAMGVIAGTATAHMGTPGMAAAATAIAALAPAAARLAMREYALRGRGVRQVQHATSVGARAGALGVAAGENVGQPLDITIRRGNGQGAGDQPQ